MGARRVYGHRREALRNRSGQQTLARGRRRATVRHETNNEGARISSRERGKPLTRTTNARIAGTTLLLYIAVGVTQMIVSRRAGQLGSMAQHADAVRGAVLLGLTTCFIALTLGVALYAITREQDPDLAMLALTCRVAEAVV